MNSKMENVKEVEKEILNEFAGVCEQLHLKWYAGYGTTLGAVRHKGFIPWDDDIDVVMLRRDYETFCKEAPALLPDNYFVQNLESEKEYCQPFAKLRRSDTTFWEIGTQNDDINHGIYMDIFPLDYYPENPISKIVFMMKRVIYDNFLYQAGDIQKLQGYRKMFARIYKCLKGNLTRREAGIKKEKLVKKYAAKNGKLVSCMVSDTPKREAVPMDVYGEGVKLPFDDMEIIVPSRYDYYLTRVYGNYMQFPPEEERVPLHTCNIIDTEKSYLEYKN